MNKEKEFCLWLKHLLDKKLEPEPYQWHIIKNRLEDVINNEPSNYDSYILGED